MKHYGIWLVNGCAWLMDGDGIIFWTTSKAVAEAQLKACDLPFPVEVREFMEAQEEEG